MRTLCRFCFLVTALVAALGLAPAAAEAACGTVVLPPAVGQGSPTAVTSLDWLLTNSLANSEAIEQLYRPLVWLDNNLNYDPAMSLASAVTTSDGGQTWHLTIKPWMWSDGVPVTASDVVFTFELIRRIGPSYVRYKVGGIPNLLDHVAALSSHQVELRLTRRVNPEWFLRLGLGSDFKPLPAHVYRGLDLAALRARQTDPSLFAVSDGPFLLKQWQLSRHLTLVPNPHFGGVHSKLKRLVVDFLEGDDPLQALQAGEIDAANIPFRLWDQARALRGFHTETMAGPFSYVAMILNLRSTHAPFLRDTPVRQAIAAAIDQKEIIDLLFHGQGEPIHGPVPVAMTGFLSPQARAGYANLEYDPAHARALLDRAGWKPGPDGVRRSRGRRLAFDVAVPTAGASILMMQIVQRNLAEIGIALSLRGIEFSQLLATLDGNGNAWDGILISWTVENFPGTQRFFSTDGEANYGHYHDARTDALDEAVISEPGFGALYAAEDHIAEQQPWIFLPSGKTSTLTRNGLEGLTDTVGTDGLWAPERLRLDGPLACPAAPQQTAQETGDAYPRGH